MIILHFHLQPQFKNELFHILHIISLLTGDMNSIWGVHHLHIEQQSLGTHYLMSSNNMTTRKPLKGKLNRYKNLIRDINFGHECSVMYNICKDLILSIF